MASTAEGRYSRFLRRAMFWSLAVAAAAIGALFLGAGQASAKPIEIPGIGTFDVPDALPVPPAFADFDYPNIQVGPRRVVPAVISEPAVIDEPAAVETPAAVEVPAAVVIPAVAEVPAAVVIPAVAEVPAAVVIPAVAELPAAVEIPAAVGLPAVLDIPSLIRLVGPPALPVTQAPAIAAPAEGEYKAPLAVIEFSTAPRAQSAQSVPATAANPGGAAQPSPVDLLRTHLPFLSGILEPLLPAPFGAPAPQVAEPSPAAVAVEAARGKIGSDYSMGATGPDAFDCSGLVQWSYEQAGVEVPRTSYAQLASGTPISQDQLEPGDVVSFYGGGHSGLYAGDGQVIHASTYGTGVVMSPMSSMPYAGARRY